MEQLALLCTVFIETLCFIILRKICPENTSIIKSNGNNGCFTWRPILHFWSYLAKLFLEWEIFQTKVVEDAKTHILCSLTFFFFRKSCRLWCNVEKILGRPQWRMRISLWVPRLQTHTSGICNSYCFSTQNMVARTRHNVTLYLHCLPCYFLLLTCWTHGNFTEIHYRVTI